MSNEGIPMSDMLRAVKQADEELAEFRQQHPTARGVIQQLTDALERKRRESCRGTRVKGYNCAQMVPDGEYGEVADEPCSFCQPVLPALARAQAWLRAHPEEE